MDNNKRNIIYKSIVSKLSAKVTTNFIQNIPKYYLIIFILKVYNTFKTIN